jgi:hypothetical protein
MASQAFFDEKNIRIQRLRNVKKNQKRYPQKLAVVHITLRLTVK